jgi:hypothetical protein
VLFLFIGEALLKMFGRIFGLYTTLDERQCKVYVLFGKVLGVIGKSGRNRKEFSGAHGLACPSENEIYIAETANWRVQKILIKK